MWDVFGVKDRRVRRGEAKKFLDLALCPVCNSLIPVYSAFYSAGVDPVFNQHVKVHEETDL